jgi:hypothetical protein
MDDAIDGASHNAPVNMATNSPNRPAVAKSASFAMDQGYPSRPVRYPVNTQFSNCCLVPGYGWYRGQLQCVRFARHGVKRVIGDSPADGELGAAFPPMLTPAAYDVGCEAPDPSAGASLDQPLVRCASRMEGGDPANSNNPFYSDLTL